MWGEPAAPRPYSTLVAALTAAADGAVIVAHSLGCCATLHAVAAGARPAGVVLVAPPIGRVPSLFADDALVEWRRQGARRTVRPAPFSASPTRFDISWSFAADYLARPEPSLGALVELGCPTLAIVCSGDDESAELAAVTCEDAGVPVEWVDGPHRWWEQPEPAAVTSAMIAGFTSVFTDDEV